MGGKKRKKKKKKKSSSNINTLVYVEVGDLEKLVIYCMQWWSRNFSLGGQD